MQNEEDQIMRSHPDPHDKRKRHLARQNELCSQCKSLNLTELLKARPGIGGTFLSKYDAVIDPERLTCAFCDLCAFTSDHVDGMSRSRTGSRHVRVFPGSLMVQTHNLAANCTEHLGVAFAVHRGSPAAGLGPEKRGTRLRQGFIAPVVLPDNHSAAFLARLVDREQVDYGIMKDWIWRCEKDHGDTCHLHNQRPRGFKCIDVWTRKRIAPRPEENYYALSYCWKGAHVETTDDHCVEDIEDHIPLPTGSIPQVIEDAITVVKNLARDDNASEHFLWVDRYCIKQNCKSTEEEKDKGLQLQAMHEIYGGAIATLIAAPIRDSEPGLPGVGRARCIKQPAEYVNGILLAHTFAHLSIVLESTDWVTRGWTYQELMLSTRCLFFTDVQVYFACDSISACESIAVSSAAYRCIRRRPNSRLEVLGVNAATVVGTSTKLRDFSSHLSYYKRRKLTNSSDMLRAFDGLLAKLELVNIWGVPIALPSGSTSTPTELDMQVAFAKGLWWENPGDVHCDKWPSVSGYSPLDRIPQHPSWTWAGWIGPTRAHPPESRACDARQGNDVDVANFRIRFYLESPIGTEISLLKWWQNRSFSWTSTCFRVLHVETQVHRIRIRQRSEATPLTACLCECPLEEPVCRILHETHTHNVRFFKKIEGSAEAVFSDDWAMIVLFRKSDPKFGGLNAGLVIEWQDALRYRTELAGVAYFYEQVLGEGSPKHIELI